MKSISNELGRTAFLSRLPSGRDFPPALRARLMQNRFPLATPKSLNPCLYDDVTRMQNCKCTVISCAVQYFQHYISIVIPYLQYDTRLVENWILKARVKDVYFDEVHTRDVISTFPLDEVGAAERFSSVFFCCLNSFRLNVNKLRPNLTLFC